MIHQNNFSSISYLASYSPEEYTAGDLLFAYVDRSFLYGHKACGLFRLHSGFAASGETHDGILVVQSSAITDYYWKRITKNVPKVWSSPVTELIQNAAVTVTHDADVNNERIVNAFEVVVLVGSGGYVSYATDGLADCLIGPIDQDETSNPYGVRLTPGSSNITLNGERPEVIVDQIIPLPADFGEWVDYSGCIYFRPNTSNLQCVIYYLDNTQYKNSRCAWLRESLGVWSFDSTSWPGTRGSWQYFWFKDDGCIYYKTTYSEPFDDCGMMAYDDQSGFWSHLYEWNEYFTAAPPYSDFTAAGRGGIMFLQNGNPVVSTDICRLAPNPPYTYHPGLPRSLDEYYYPDFDYGDLDQRWVDNNDNPFYSLEIGQIKFYPWAPDSFLKINRDCYYGVYGPTDCNEKDLVALHDYDEWSTVYSSESYTPVERDIFTGFTSKFVGKLGTTLLMSSNAKTGDVVTGCAPLVSPAQPNDLINTISTSSTFYDEDRIYNGWGGWIEESYFWRSREVYSVDAAGTIELICRPDHIVVPPSLSVPVTNGLSALNAIPVNTTQMLFINCDGSYGTGSHVAAIGHMQESSVKVYESAYILKPANVCITSAVNIPTPTIVSTDVNGAICRFALTDTANNLYKWSGSAWVACTYLTANTKAEFLTANFTQAITDISAGHVALGICVVLHSDGIDAPIFVSVDVQYTRPGQWKLDEMMVVDNVDNKTEKVSSTQTRYTNLSTTTKNIVLRVGII